MRRCLFSVIGNLQLKQFILSGKVVDCVAANCAPNHMPGIKKLHWPTEWTIHLVQNPNEVLGMVAHARRRLLQAHLLALHAQAFCWLLLRPRWPICSHSLAAYLTLSQQDSDPETVWLIISHYQAHPFLPSFPSRWKGCKNPSRPNQRVHINLWPPSDVCGLEHSHTQPWAH